MDIWEQCLDCPYVPLCGGGCAYESFVTFGDYTKSYARRRYLLEQLWMYS